MANASFRTRLHIGVDYKDTIRELQAIGRGIRSPQIRGVVAETLLKWVDKNFKQEGKLNYPSGGWAPLSDSYSKVKGRSKTGTRSVKKPFTSGTSYLSINPVTKKSKLIFYKGSIKNTSEKSRVLKRILLLSGKMEGSFSEKGTAMGRPPKGNTRVIIGSDVDYSRYHEFGTSKMPHRKILPWPSIAREVSEKAVRAFIQSVVAKKSKI